MRVIAGKAKGRKLLSVPGESTRPITDRVKESLFNILGERVVGARFLDLFAGTGSVGIEALSRGARQAVFVEISGRAIKTLKRNLELTGLAEGAKVIQQDVFKFIEREAVAPFDEASTSSAQRLRAAPFDIIYVAPPQYKGLWARTLQALDEKDLLTPDGGVVAQIYPKEYEDLKLKSLQLTDQRKYGSTLLCFFAPIVENRVS
jgi:16S rRNA (guanine(966)-N(2))-methyltransferase RsmD